MFRKQKPGGRTRPKVAVYYVDAVNSRAAADWLTRLDLCQSVAILSDAPSDTLWTCVREKPDLLVLEAMPDAMEQLDDPDKDITGRCELAVQVKEALPRCRVYLVCSAEFRRLEPAMEKAVETHLIDGYRFGGLSRQQIETWLAETGAKPKH